LSFSEFFYSNIYSKDAGVEAFSLARTIQLLCYVMLVTVTNSKKLQPIHRCFA